MKTIQIYIKLITKKQRLTAKAYEGYRSVREFQRENSNTTDEQIEELLSGTSDYWNNENSKKNARLLTTQRDYMASIVSTDITRRFLLPPEIVQAHDEGIIHFHDADYFGQNAIHNCSLINLEDMLQSGTCINIERDEEVVRNECKIVDFTKSSAGVRSIYLNKEARKIFCMRCMMSCIFKKRAVTKNVLNNMGDKILNFTRVI